MSGRVLVAGAGGSGIGSAIVRELMKAGRSVLATYHKRSPDLACGSDGGQVEWQHADYSDPSGLGALIDIIQSKTSDITDLIYAPGVTYDTISYGAELGRAKQVFDINYWSAFVLANACARKFARAKSGHIVFISSAIAGRASFGNCVYAASKAALEAYCRTLALELARTGVCVNCVAPGIVDTDMVARYAQSREEIESRLPMRRYGQPEEVAKVVAFLVSGNASYITGESIKIDGGLTLSTGGIVSS
jgi:NAD(P)-dependent dehydrogenase (short-subunit alcohol dehydrogenase family)